MITAAVLLLNISARTPFSPGRRKHNLRIGDERRHATVCRWRVSMAPTKIRSAT